METQQQRGREEEAESVDINAKDKRWKRTKEEKKREKSRLKVKEGKTDTCGKWENNSV